MQTPTNRRWLVTGVLGLALLGGTGCADESARTVSGGPAVVMGGTGSSVAPPSGNSGHLTASGSSGKAPSATTGTTQDSPKKVPIASPHSVESPDTPPSADTP